MRDEGEREGRKGRREHGADMKERTEERDVVKGRTEGRDRGPRGGDQARDDLEFSSYLYM